MSFHLDEKEKVESILAKYKQIGDNFFNLVVFSLDCFNKLFANNTVTAEDKIYLAFNGGKDVLASYILIKYFFYCKHNNLDYAQITSFKSFCNKNNINKLEIAKYNIVFVYFLSSQNYEEEVDYVIRFVKREGIEVFYLYTDYVSGLNFLINNFGMRVIVMGTRKDDVMLSSRKVDPIIETDLVHPSTYPYPNFIRFYPVFNFDYNDIWRLILNTGFEYLDLYNRGYSSIGKKNNTKINKNLILSSGLALPAWCLEEYMSERSFRMEN